MTGMVKLYVERIKAGRMTLEDVPPRWREQVREALEDELGTTGRHLAK